jgi:hypothetical protein
VVVRAGELEQAVRRAARIAHADAARRLARDEKLECRLPRFRHFFPRHGLPQRLPHWLTDRRKRRGGMARGVASRPFVPHSVPRLVPNVVRMRAMRRPSLARPRRMEMVEHGVEAASLMLLRCAGMGRRAGQP